MVFDHIFKYENGSYSVFEQKGMPGYFVYPTDKIFKEIEEYISKNPKNVFPAPIQPKPSKDVLLFKAEQQRQKLFAEYDLAIAMLTRAERLGNTTATAKIAAWDVYAIELQKINDTENWFIDTIWPTKPIV